MKHLKKNSQCFAVTYMNLNNPGYKSHATVDKVVASNAGKKAACNLCASRQVCASLTEVAMQYFDKNRPMQTLLLSMRGVLISPKEFFSELPVATFYANSIFLASIIIFAASFIGVPFRSFTMLFMLPVSWGLGLIGLKFWSSYISWATRSFGKAKLGKANAFHISTYACVPLMLSALPMLGIISFLWSLYLMWVALISRCHVKPGTAAIIIAIPAMIFAVSATELVAFLFQLFPKLGQH